MHVVTSVNSSLAEVTHSVPAGIVGHGGTPWCDNHCPHLSLNLSYLASQCNGASISMSVYSIMALVSHILI